MRRRILYCLLIALVCLTSCSRRERVVPRGKMAKIYAEMFVADQQVFNQGQQYRAMADTSFVYEPIFEKYGYTSDDYRASVAYYIKDANRFARILRNTGTILEGQLKDLKKQKHLLELQGDAESLLKEYSPEKIFFMTSVRNPNTMGADTLIYFLDANGGKPLFDPRDWESPTYYGPEKNFKSVQKRSFGDKLSNGKKTFAVNTQQIPTISGTSSSKGKDSKIPDETSQKAKTKKAGKQDAAEDEPQNIKSKKGASQDSPGKSEETTQPTKTKKSVKQNSQGQTETTSTDAKSAKTKSTKTGKTGDEATQTEAKPSKAKPAKTEKTEDEATQTEAKPIKAKPVTPAKKDEE
ncbi:MAG: DUF4296 domain-containing protein [Bacteroidales bacterium]|nr:DUF4296 domain-containing protein [Bacteroidales bacterium]